MLDSLNEAIYMQALHYVHPPRINAALAEFRSQWNHHGIRTANHKSPPALWYTNIQNGPENPIAISEISYGVDYSGPLPEIATDNNIVVPRTVRVLN